MDPVLRERLAKYIPPKDQWTPVDEALYGVDDIYNVPEEKAKALRTNAIRYAFRHHYENNKFYHEYCKDQKVSPDDIKSEEDFKKIPLIPSSFFKNHPEDNEEIVKWLKAFCTGELPDVEVKNKEGNFYDVVDAYFEKGIVLMTSSGTSGKFTILPKDRLTYNRYHYAYLDALSHWVSDIDTHLIAVLPEAPPVNTIPAAGVGDACKRVYNNVWTMKGRMPIFDQSLSAEKSKHLFSPSPEDIFHQIEMAKSENHPIWLAAIPAYHAFLLSWIEKNKGHYPLPENCFISSFGGKKGIGRADVTNEEIMAGIKKVFGLPRTRYADCYGLDESSTLNIMIPSMHDDNLHIPYCVKPMILDEEMKLLPYGEEGRFAFLCPLANSYPEFIATEDKVRLLEHCPECDLPGPVIAGGISRMPGAEDRGCAVAIAKVLQESGPEDLWRA